MLAAAGTYTVLDEDAPRVPAPGPDAVARAPAADAAERGPSVFARMACGSCHRLAAAGSPGGAGPDLDRALRSHTAASLRATILDPYAGAGESGFGMPENFVRRMSRDELDDLVAVLGRRSR